MAKKIDLNDDTVAVVVGLEQEEALFQMSWLKKVLM